MKITDFTAAHIEQAAVIAKERYEKERGFVPALPDIDAVPDLTAYAENGLGVAAFEGDRMTGFLAVVSPFRHAFRSTYAVGVFSPMGANGVTDASGIDRVATYARLYQAAGEKWARAGASSHAVCLYAHDEEAQAQFFRYGFGMRSIDAIRDMEELVIPDCEGYEFRELGNDELAAVLSLDHRLDAHMAASPSFILRPSLTEETLREKAVESNIRYFAAMHNGKPVAFIRAEKDGDNFLAATDRYLHVTGAFCLREHRGKGVYQNLLNLAIRTLKSEGYTRFGVDFESINPTAYAFWPKYFSVYTHSVVRRIDEHALS